MAKTTTKQSTGLNETKEKTSIYVKVEIRWPEETSLYVISVSAGCGNRFLSGLVLQ